MTTNVLCEGDVGKKLLIRARDSSGAVINVTGASVTYIFHRADGTIQERPGTVADGPTGYFTYTLQANDIQPGHLGIQLRIILGGASICTKKIITTVLDQSS